MSNRYQLEFPSTRIARRSPWRLLKHDSLSLGQRWHFIAFIVIATLSIQILTFVPAEMLQAQETSGQQSQIAAPADATRLYYNCTEEGSVEYNRHNDIFNYVRVFSSRDQSTCTGYTGGDYILRIQVRGRAVSTFPYSNNNQYRGIWTRVSYSGAFSIYIVGNSLTYTSEADSFKIDLYDDGARFYRRVSSRLDFSCPYLPNSHSLVINDNTFETSEPCKDTIGGSPYTFLPSILFEEAGLDTPILHLSPPRFFQSRPPLAQVVRLEITQGIQDWGNNLTLVKNRRTVVRAFMETGTGRQREITAKLKGQKIPADSDFPETEMIDPVNPGMSITVMPTVAERRGDIDASLNFVLPEHWIDLEANEELRLELVFEAGANANCNETVEGDDTYNRCVERIKFTEVAAPEIVMVPLIAEDADGNEVPVSPDVLEEQYYRIMSIMPLPDREYEPLGIDRIGVYPFTFGPFKRTEHIDNTHGLMYVLKNNAAGRIGADVQQLVYLGVLEGEPDNSDRDENDRLPAGSGSGISSSVASWYAGTSGDDIGTAISYFGRRRHTGSHELGHVFDQHHPRRATEDGSLEQTCEEPSRASVPYRYYEQFAIDDSENEESWRPVLGPLGDINTEVWGLDTRFVDLPNGASVPSSVVVSDPRMVFSFMSYCNPIAGYRGQGRWMDAFHHDRIIERINEVYGFPAIRGAGDDSVVRSIEFAGAVLLSTNDEATGIDLFSVFSSPSLIGPGVPGDYTLELRDGNGSVVHSEQFTAEKSNSEPIPGYERSQSESNRAYFAFSVTDPPEYASLAITKEGTEISSFSLSSSEPTATITGPTAGQIFNSGDTINLSWSGSDPDADDLVYRIYYSTDGGTSYEILSMETSSTRGSIPASKLKGSSQARFSVSVSDGLLSSFAETPVFSVAGHAPEIKIQRPLANMVFAESQGFLLDASGYDIEDGGLSSDSFSWSSSIDGNLGTGSYLVLSADNLTPGAHTITLTATDSDNMTATATVNITITERNMLPVANDDEVFGGLEESLLIDVLANDIDTEGDFDLSSLAIDRRPRLGIAEIVMTEAGIPVIEYSPITGGEDTFTYYICDGLYRCDTADVTVAFPDCTITGSRDSDNLVGTSGDDVICGLDGGDTIDGKGGNDLIYAGFGEDLVYGRTGDDTIYGGPGNDMILGHRGDDTIYGGLSNDSLWGGGGDDIIYGGAETDELYGEADDDTLYGGDGPDTIHGGRGNDVIYGGNGDDTIRGNEGADTIYPGPGNNSILGRSPEDTVS